MTIKEEKSIAINSFVNYIDRINKLENELNKLIQILIEK